jgi:hypothetical protein
MIRVAQRPGVCAPDRHLPQRTVTAARHGRIDSYQKSKRHSAWPVHLHTEKEGMPMTIKASTGGGASAPDPIIVAMRRYLLAEQKIAELPGEEEQTPRMDAAINESANARRDLAATVPTTLNGLAAFARFIDHQSRAINDAFFDDDREHLAFYASLNQSLGIINGSPFNVAVVQELAEVEIVPWPQGRTARSHRGTVVAMVLHSRNDAVGCHDYHDDDERRSRRFC